MSSGTAIVSGIAGRYASALFELAKEAKKLDAVAEDLKALKGFLEESEQFRTLVSNPLIDRGGQIKGVAAVSKAAKLNKLTSNFLGVLAENRRLRILKAAIDAYLALLAVERGEVTAEVVSAIALSREDHAAIEKAIAKAVGRDVQIQSSVDASLMGGLIVKLGSRMVDSSLKTKLENLKISMKGV